MMIESLEEKLHISPATSSALASVEYLPVVEPITKHSFYRREGLPFWSRHLVRPNIDRKIVVMVNNSRVS